MTAWRTCFVDREFSRVLERQPPCSPESHSLSPRLPSSYSQAPEDEVILLNDGANPSASSPNIPRAPPRRRASYAHEPIRIDNSYDTPNRNITFSTWSSYVPVNSTLDDDKPLSDHDGTRNRTRARTTPTWHETVRPSHDTLVCLTFY